MKFTAQQLNELNLLLQFDLNSRDTGIKVHKTAEKKVQDAVEALYRKNLCTHPDGGYLTDEGIEIAQDADRILRVLAPEPE
ncbi:TIGR02647 family protein [Vibrio spartinae]|uniref:Phosphate-starvation-inducible E n=1 Tax=Vibrio spartinae TaxID=1918945 RepID=A0A1N6M6I1_9VIBR|nr:TIGR02647 family protein [Vibrio spartinae]QMV14764.1 Phosphate-starvation-inducible E [Vibrio spartinae]SIO94956.1 Phosphate-starvation-inducible E [Vibrio spartinae]